MSMPTFYDEFRAAGITDWRFNWSTDERGGETTFEFHPEMPEAERQKVLAVFAAHDGPLSTARGETVDAIRVEASRRIAALFGQPPGSVDLVFAELNALAEAAGILERRPEMADPRDVDDLAVLKGIWAQIRAIRDAGRDARAKVQAAKTPEEARAVKPVWP
ncbi:MAG: hypothetical protein ACREXW_18785 [Gammaproteobacteria bacterium]